MEFVNSIAQIVHQEVSLHSGAANKNIGDAFLLVWKLAGSRRDTSRRSSLVRTRSQSSCISRGSTQSGKAAGPLVCSLHLRRVCCADLYSFPAGGRMSQLVNADDSKGKEEAAANIADQALASFIVIQAALKRSAKLQQFSAR